MNQSRVIVPKKNGDDNPVPPDRFPQIPVEEPPDTPETEPDAPVEEPEPEPPKRLSAVSNQRSAISLQQSA